jgi:hypothetical protein
MLKTILENIFPSLEEDFQAKKELLKANEKLDRIKLVAASYVKLGNKGDLYNRHHKTSAIQFMDLLKAIAQEFPELNISFNVKDLVDNSKGPVKTSREKITSVSKRISEKYWKVTKLINKGKTIKEATKQIGMSEGYYYRINRLQLTLWKK